MDERIEGVWKCQLITFASTIYISTPLQYYIVQSVAVLDRIVRITPRSGLTQQPPLFPASGVEWDTQDGAVAGRSDLPTGHRRCHRRPPAPRRRLRRPRHRLGSWRRKAK